MSMELKERYQQVQEQIRQLCQETKREQPQLLAVSKVHSSDSIRKVYELGHRYFGENYAQELVSKAEELKDLHIKWSFIGHIQSNKIKSIVEVADEIQTLASLKHAKAINKAAIECGKSPFKVYLAVNAEDEPQKNGISLDELPSLHQAISKECPELEIQGIMSIPPKKYQDNLDQVPRTYEKLRQAANDIGLGNLSVGMSGDLKIALMAGTNLVRIGTAIFGTRPPKG